MFHNWIIHLNNSMKKPTYRDLEKQILKLNKDLESKKIAITESEDRFRMYFNHLTEAISFHKMITDEKGNIVDFTYEELNPAREKMINLNSSELKNKTVRQINPDVGDIIFEKYGTVALTGEPATFEYYSSVFKRHLKVKVFSPKYGYVATIIEDLSNQKKAEELLNKTLEKYRTIFENAVEGIAVVDHTGTIREWNKFLELKTGFSKTTAIGMKLWDIQVSVMTDDWKSKYPVENIEKVWMDIVRTLPENEIITREGQYLDAEKKLVLTEDLICPILLNGEKFLCIIQRDLTERINSQQALKINEQKLKQLNATKDKLFSIIAHDLRSPFNSILGYSQHLRDNIRKYNVEESEKYLDIINSSAQFTLNLLINLLSWAKHQSGQTIFSPELLSLQQIINEVVDLLGSSAKIKNITINHALPKKTMIYADKNMLKTILQNLISNAVKFTNPDGIISIYAMPVYDHIEITVSDNGIGISKEAIGKLFEIETNTPTSGTFDEPGSGLGLIICREFVEKHGGKIWVESKKGKGSEFKFTFPVRL
jgi:PAS domain S-box-containing protein